MRCLVVAALLLALSGVSGAQQFPFGPPAEGEVRVALVMANNKNAVVPLTNAINDARSVEKALSNLGFQVTPVTDGTKEEMERAIDKFTTSIKKDAIAVIYFAGHGIGIEGTNYLIPADYNPKDPTDQKYPKYHAISVNEMLDNLETSPARIRLLILDACRNNPYRGLGSGGLAGYTEVRGTYVAFSTAPGGVALDAGFFTPTLVAELANRQPGSTLDQVFTRVRQRVAQMTNGKQIPYSTNGLLGEWYPFGPVRDHPQRGPVSPALAAAAEQVVGTAYGEAALDRLDAASGNLVDAVQLDPNNSSAYVLRGLVRILKGEKSGELEDFSEAIRIAPADFRGYLNRGLALKSAGKCMEAIEDFNRAVELAPRHAVAYRYRASCLVEVGSYDAAEADNQQFELLSNEKP